MHHNVNLANILIDTSVGGKPMLANFGTALKPREENLGFTKSYASPGAFDVCMKCIIHHWQRFLTNISTLFCTIPRHQLVELLAVQSYELEDFADLRPDKIDLFALGAAIFELLTCKKF